MTMGVLEALAMVSLRGVLRYFGVRLIVGDSAFGAEGGDRIGRVDDDLGAGANPQISENTDT